MKVVVHIMPKENLLDPEGAAIEHAMHSLGYDNSSNVRMGKIVEFTMKGTKNSKELSNQIDQLCQQLLSNPNIEDYRFEIKATEK